MKTWYEWLEEYEHLCPRCPEGLEEHVVLVTDLVEFLESRGDM